MYIRNRIRAPFPSRRNHQRFVSYMEAFQNVIYSIQSTKCPHEKYVGETHQPLCTTTFSWRHCECLVGELFSQYCLSPFDFLVLIFKGIPQNIFKRWALVVKFLTLLQHKNHSTVEMLGLCHNFPYTVVKHLSYVSLPHGNYWIYHCC